MLTWKGADVPAGLVVTVIERFSLPHHEPAGWAEAWEAIAECALRQPACRAFRICRDKPYSNQVSLISEWDSAETFNHFIRESGVLWLERGQHPEIRGTFSIHDGATGERSGSWSLGPKRFRAG